MRYPLGSRFAEALMARTRLLLAVTAVFALGVGLVPRLSSPLAESSHAAVREVREAFDGVLHGTHSNLQLGPFELAYRLHRVQMGSAEVLDIGLERVRRDDAGTFTGNDWALSVSVAKAPADQGPRYLGNLSLQVGSRHPLDVWLDSAREPGLDAVAPCEADAGVVRAC
jgi:hypothetical protein